MFAVGIAAGILFVRRQNRSATPMLDMALFSYGPFSSSILANFLSIVGLIGFLFFTSQHLQLVLGLSPAGGRAGHVAGCDRVDGRRTLRRPLARRFAPWTLMVAGLILVSAGFLLILLFRHDLSVAAVVVSFMVLELGVGVSQTISNDTIVASVPAAKAGAASAVSETAYELGAVVGTATLGTIFSAFYRSNVDAARRPHPGAGRRRPREYRRRDIGGPRSASGAQWTARWNPPVPLSIPVSRLPP